MTSSVTGLVQRRNCSWAAATRAASVEASRNLGDAGLPGIPGFVFLFRDENASPGMDAAGITTLRRFPGLPGIFITDAHTCTVSTSDYYPLTNARVVDKACGITRKNAIPYVNNKVPTMTRNIGGVDFPGSITERKALLLEGRLSSALRSGLVDTQPQDAVAAKALVGRTNNILATENLQITVGVQPFGYSKYITVQIGMTVQA